VGKLKKKLD